MKKYRKINDDIERIVILKHGSGGIRQVIDARDNPPTYAGDSKIKARIIRRDQHGVLKIDEVFGSRRKKQSRFLRPLEKIVRKKVKRNLRVMQRYLNLHERSNCKKKNGWIRDCFRNASKARRRS
ncbi:MAG: hypothetical protein LAE24_07940 [Candidatus Contendobacter sp.]|jgi:hypothetical protein|nr:hypothetical protein [Candidatus Contendobacter sp.]